MKKILSSLFFLLICFQIFGQCNVDTWSMENNTKVFLCQQEKLYSNNDFENGVQVVYGQLSILQSSLDKTKMQFILFVDVGASGSKTQVTPWVLTIIYDDVDSLLIKSAERLENPRMIGNIRMQKGLFILNAKEFKNIMKFGIKNIYIMDNRNDNAISCEPYFHLFKEQTDCLIKAVNR